MLEIFYEAEACSRIFGCQGAVSGGQQKSENDIGVLLLMGLSGRNKLIVLGDGRGYIYRLNSSQDPISIGFEGKN
jgi:hypothetical protein